MIRRPIKHVRSKKQLGPSQQPFGTPLVPTIGVIAGASVTVTFGQQITLDGLPQWTDGNGNLPVSAVPLSAVSMQLTYAIGTAAPYVVPFQDIGVRNMVGGYVVAGSYS